MAVPPGERADERRPRPARVLLLGGLDPSGGAGVTVDAAVVALHGAHPLPVALTTTTQGARGFEGAYPIPSEVWRGQVEAALGGDAPDAVKVGYVGDAAIAAEVADALRGFAARCPVVVDPVLSATAGGMEAGDELVRAYVSLLAPLASLVTPNTPELARLAAGDASALLGGGASAVLHKGGHGRGDEAVDELWTRDVHRRFVRVRQRCGAVRGTGCALASAIAAHLAQGRGLEDACGRAGDWLATLLAGLRPRPDDAPQPLPLSRDGTSAR